MVASIVRKASRRSEKGMDMVEDDLAAIADEAEADGSGNADGVVQFEGEDDSLSKKLTGRRAKRERDAKKKMKAGTFESLGLSEEVLKAIKRKGFRLPTPIQRKAMPIILQGSDVIGMARTGSGKTAAFVIPMLERLKSHSLKAGARALLLSPTRELALQTHKAVRELARFTDLRTAVLVGGDALEAQFAELAANPDILVATPGRLLHHLAEVSGMSLRSIQYFVLDEADRLFEMGFAEQIKEIVGKLGEGRQSLLFSATLPRSLADFAAAGLNAPQLVRLDMERRVSPDLATLFFTVRREDTVGALLHLVREVVSPGQSTIVFTATRHHVEYLAALMARENIPAAAVYGSMDQAARKIHVAKFRAKKVGLLITTDVAARGIDIPLLDNVINLDFPCKPELFVHRVGRVARMGRPGTAYSLLTRDELPYLLDLGLFLGRTVHPAPLVPIREQVEAAAAAGAVPDANASIVYGAYPTSMLGLQLEKLRAVQAEAPELAAMQQSLDNAFGLYVRTRPPASAQSVARSKQLPKEGQHPALLALLPAQQHVDLEGETALAQFTAALRSFRPAATVLEAEIAGSRSVGTASDVLKPGANAVMQRKRAAHSATIAREREKRARIDAVGASTGAKAQDDRRMMRNSLPGDGSDGAEVDVERQAVSGQAAPTSQARAAAVSAMEFGDGVLSEGKYRDSGLYIGHRRDDMADPDESFQADRLVAELQGAVLDLTAEDQDGMQAQARRFHWDARKKRYVQLRGQDATSGQAAGRVRNESGAKVVAGAKDRSKNKGVYQKWVKAQRKRVAVAGSEEDGGGTHTAAAVPDTLTNRFLPSMKHRSWRTPAGKASSPGDGSQRGDRLKSKDQVRKERVKDARRKQWLQEKQGSAKAGNAKGRGGDVKRKGGGNAKASGPKAKSRRQ